MNRLFIGLKNASIIEFHPILGMNVQNNEKLVTPSSALKINLSDYNHRQFVKRLCMI